MAAIFQTTFWNAFSWMEFFCILMTVSLKCVSQGPINTIPVLIKIMAWHRTGDKPLSEPMIALFTDAYMCLLAWMSSSRWCLGEWFLMGEYNGMYSHINVIIYDKSYQPNGFLVIKTNIWRASWHHWVSGVLIIFFRSSFINIYWHSRGHGDSIHQ